MGIKFESDQYHIDHFNVDISYGEYATYHIIHMICKFLIEPSLKNSWLEQDRIFEKFLKFSFEKQLLSESVQRIFCIWLYKNSNGSHLVFIFICSHVCLY